MIPTPLPTRTLLFGTFILLFLSLMAVPVTPSHAAVIAPTHHRLTTSNGYAALIFTEKDKNGPQRKITHFYPHIYRQSAPGAAETKNLCYDSYWGIRLGGTSAWLNEVPITTMEFDDQFGPTSTIHIRQIFSVAGLQDVTIDQYIFVPKFGTPDASPLVETFYVHLIKITNPNVGTDCKLFTLFNFHVTPTYGDPQGESIAWQAPDNAFVESHPQVGSMVYQSITPPTRYCHSTDDPNENPWQMVKNGQDLVDRTGIRPGFDRVAAFQYNLGTSGGEHWRGVLVGATNQGTRDLLQAMSRFLGAAPLSTLVEREADAYISIRTSTGPTDYPYATAVLEDELLVNSQIQLFNGQCREANEGACNPHGQILASLPPGIWNITWVRDGAYAINALSRTGHPERASAALNFFLRGQAGEYEEYFYQGPDLGVGAPYDISVCRYFGCGREESDGNDAASGWNPNIEFDNFGLFLWALGEYLQIHGPDKLDANWEYVLIRTAENLIRLTGDDGLLRKDSSAWERHLDEAAQYAYSSIMAVAGLESVAEYYFLAGEHGSARRYRMAALRLKRGIVENLITPGDVIAGAAGSAYVNLFDAGVVEAFNFGIVDPSSSTGQTTLARFESLLRLGPDRGYKRISGRPGKPNDWYDAQEWTFIDLRLASANFRVGNPQAGASLLGFVEDVARVNNFQVPELLSDGVYQPGSEDDSNATPGTDNGLEAQGATPMMGFGAGTSILAKLDQHIGNRPALRGTIRNSASQPVRGAEVLLLQNGQVVRTAVSVTDGRYIMLDPPDGDYELHVSKGNASVVVPSTAPLASGGTHDMTLPDAGFTGHQAIAPGVAAREPRWTSGQKNGFFTAMSRDSRVWATLHKGMLTEVYYPQLDKPNTGLSEFIVTDGASWHDRESEIASNLDVLFDESEMRLTTWSASAAHGWRLVKTWYTDPERDSIILDVNLVLTGGGPTPQLWYRFEPHLNDSGWGDVAGAVQLREGSTGNPLTFLTCEDGPVASAVTATVPILDFSNAPLGASQGTLADLLAGGQYRLDQRYLTTAETAVEQLMRFDTSTTRKFQVVIGFGENVANAVSTANSTRARLLAGDDVFDEYSAGWQQTYAGLRLPATIQSTPSGVWVLKALEDKTWPGAFIASPALPWGEEETDGTTAYHKVWGRDTYHTCSALYAVEDYNAVLRALHYLDDIHQEPDGSMPQHALLDGTVLPHGAEQLDETALPMVLVYKLKEVGRLPAEDEAKLWRGLVKPAADFLEALSAPVSQERWEEEYGYSPSTLAATISGLICAAEIADSQGDAASANRYRAKADYWEANIENWTYTTTGVYPGHSAYYLRINQNTDPNDGQALEINNGGGTHDERAIISGDFLELIRFGVRSPYTDEMCNTLKLYDQELRVDFSNGSFAYYRYNNDGFGEKADGSAYLAPPAFQGVGRPWTLTVEEHSNYGLAKGINVDAPSYLSMLGLINSGGLLPEQVWDDFDLPSRGLFEGQGTGSATPLAWAHASFVKLQAAIVSNQVTDYLPVVARRYGTDQITQTLPDFNFILTRQIQANSGPQVVHLHLQWGSDWECASRILMGVDLTLPDGNIIRVALDAVGSGRFGGSVSLAESDLSPGLISAHLMGIYDFLTFEELADIMVTPGASTTATPSPTRSPLPSPSPTPQVTPRPATIAFAGYMDTALTTSAGGSFSFFAFVRNPDNQILNGVELYYQGVGTGSFLQQLTQDSYGWPSQMWGAGLPQTRELLEMQLFAADGLLLSSWPHLVVH